MSKQQFSPVARDAAILNGVGVKGSTTSPTDIARVLTADKNSQGLSPAMAMARRCNENNVGMVLDAAERLMLRPATDPGLNLLAVEFFMRMLGQRMSPRYARDSSTDVAALAPLPANHLARVMDMQVRGAHLVEVKRQYGGAPGLNDAATALRDAAPTVAQLLNGDVDIRSVIPTVANGLLVGAALTVTSVDATNALVDLAQALIGSADPNIRGYGERLVGVVAERQHGDFPGLAKIDVAAAAPVVALRLGALLDSAREQVGYETGGVALPPPCRELSDAQLDALMTRAESAIGNVGDQVVTSDVAIAIARRWTGKNFLTVDRLRWAQSDDGRHGVRYSAGKAVSGGVATLNVEFFGPESGQGGRMVKRANVHFAVVTPVILPPSVELAG